MVPIFYLFIGSHFFIVFVRNRMQHTVGSSDHVGVGVYTPTMQVRLCDSGVRWTGNETAHSGGWRRYTDDCWFRDNVTVVGRQTWLCSWNGWLSICLITSNKGYQRRRRLIGQRGVRCGRNAYARRTRHRIGIHRRHNSIRWYDLAIWT